MVLLPGKAGWQELAEIKRKAIYNAIPEKWRLPLPLPAVEEQRNVAEDYINQYLSKIEIEITASDVTDLVQQIANRVWTSEEVVTAFCHRAALAHQLTNCLHEVFFDQAITEARLHDQLLASGAEPVGPLHGVPVSFKDQFHVRGVETTMGYVGWIDTLEGEKGTGKERNVESELVREVRALGGIPFCKTSLPHTVMSMETWNNIVGFTLNPHNRLMGSGGSSGGEGALVGMRGSPVGFGTDIGGSIGQGVPSAYCGIFGIRPSHGRVPYGGAANSMPGQQSVPSVCGPMTTSARDLRLMLRAILSQQPWLHDPAVVELPWREKLTAVNDKKLTFGLYLSADEVNPLPPVKRALQTVINLIQELGYSPSHKQGTDIAREAWDQDGGMNIYQHIGLSGEPLMGRVAHDYGLAPKLPATGDKIHDANLRQRAYQTEYIKYWNSTALLTKTRQPVDAVLCPVTPFAALELGETQSIAFAQWVNVLDYTSVVLPVTKVDPELDIVENDYVPLSDEDKAIPDEYDPQLQQGTSVAVQLVGRRFQEEKMVALLEMFEEALKG